MTDSSASQPGEGYFEELYRDAPFGYVVTDHEDIIVRINGTLLGWSGLDESGMLGRPFRDLLAPGSQIVYETRHLPVLRLQGFANEVALQLVKSDGSLLPVLINASTAHEEDGAEVRIGVLDASLRVSYERELLTTQRSAESLAARVAILQDASAAFAEGISETEMAATLARIVEDALVATAACVALVTPSGGLDVVAGENLLADLIRDDRELLGNTVLEFEKPVVVGASEADAQTYPRIVAALREARLRAVAVFPIVSDSKPIGITAAFFGRERTLSANETELVLAVARQASQVLTRSRAQTQLAHAALHDPLTGLANRALIRHSIALGLTAVAESGQALTLMFIDLDGFKSVNDRLGHHVGDDVLREVASRLAASVRATDIVGRYGGDEFVVICTDANSDDATAISDRIHREIRSAFPVGDGLAISASIGVAVHASSGSSTDGGTIPADAIITAADAAMYESKRLGRDRTTRVEV